MRANDSVADARAVRVIRAVCAAEFGQPLDYPFFYMCYRDGETADEALLRLFRQERPHHDSDFDTILVLCHG